MGRVARPPPALVPMDDHRPLPKRNQHHRQPPLSFHPLPRAALHGTGHGAPLMHWEVVEWTHLLRRLPTRMTPMSDFDGCPWQDDCHHRWSRSRSPVSPSCAAQTLAEREERYLAEAAPPVGQPAG